MQLSSNLFQLLSLSSLLSTETVLGDLPVHCLRSQITGKWSIYLSDGSSVRRTCGHQTPDSETGQPGIKKYSKEFRHKRRLTLESPNTATLSDTKRKWPKKGTWSMIYDEGFSVTADDFDMFAFSHFEQPTFKDGKKMFKSFCGMTEIGWYRKRVKADKKKGRPAKTLYGCFRAERMEEGARSKIFHHLGSLAQMKKKGIVTSNGPKKPLALLSSEARAISRSGSAIGMSQLHFQKEIVTKINTEQNMWRAKTYNPKFLQEKLLQLQKSVIRSDGRRRIMREKTGPIHDRPISVTKLNLQSVSRNRLGPRPAAPGSSPSGPPESSQPNKNLSEAEDRAMQNMLLVNSSKFPKNFDWYQKGYLTGTYDQADCGSCYAVAAVRMLSARYRVYKNNASLPDFSINFPLYCSDTNQGCGGGYPSLVAMWSRDVGLVPEACTGEYTTSPGTTCKTLVQEHSSGFGKCIQEAKQEGTLARVSSWSYVGGYYGGCSENLMRQNLYKYGPLAVALEPGHDFMYYSTGIYKSSSIKHTPSLEWIRVNHAVLLTGWGEEGGVPYWVVQNSWGPAWGEDGFIRILRGVDESGIEFQAVAAEVEEGTVEEVMSYTKQVSEVTAEGQSM